MQYSDTTNNDGLIQMCELTTGLGLASITGNANRKKQFTVYLNIWARKVAHWIWQSDKDWHFDDSNHTDFPIATTALVNNQYDYLMPTDLLQLRQVEIMNNDGDYSTLKLMKSADPRLKDQRFQEDAGLPTHYRKIGRSIIVYPKVSSDDVTLAAGLRLTFNREIDAFTTDDTTQEPGFAAQFHPILYYGASFEWCSIKGKPSIAAFCYQQIFGVENTKNKGLKGELEKFYSTQDKNEKDIIIPYFINETYE